MQIMENPPFTFMLFLNFPKLSKIFLPHSRELTEDNLEKNFATNTLGTHVMTEGMWSTHFLHRKTVRFYLSLELFRADRAAEKVRRSQSYHCLFR